jgi:hypothetical protein
LFIIRKKGDKKRRRSHVMVGRGNRKIKRNGKGVETTDGSRRKTWTQFSVFDGESEPLQD